MIFADRDDLPDAPGLESLGPLGSLALADGEAWRIPRSGRPFEPGRAVPAGDVGALRDAARFASEALLLVDRHAHASQRALMAAWVEGALGPPRSVHSIGLAEELAWFDGVLLMTLRDAFTVACATPERLRALLARSPSGPLSLAPATCSYGSLAARPAIGARIGAMTHPDPTFPETFELHEAGAGCWARGTLQGTFETQRYLAPGGHVETAPRHADRFARASAFGEWQPGLRDPAGLRARLEANGAPEALGRAVIAADDLVGGFRGTRGIPMLAPWAASLILERTAPGVWAKPRHPYNGAWFFGWTESTALRTDLYLDETGRVWASWQDPGDDEVQVRVAGETVERWFERELYLLEHGYASEATCRPEQALPGGLALREGLSDAAAKVFVDGDAVWLVEERGIQRMSRRAGGVSEVLAVAAAFP